MPLNSTVGLMTALFLLQLLCLIGEAFDEQSEDVNGAVVNIRGKGDKLAMWTRDCNRVDANRKIGYVERITGLIAITFLVAIPFSFTWYLWTFCHVTT